MKKLPNFYPHSLCATLFLLLTVITVNAGQQPTLTTQQIIRQAETQFNGRVSSVSQTANNNSYNVRLLTHTGKVIIINVDANTGKMQKTNPAKLKNNNENTPKPDQNTGRNDGGRNYWAIF